ncbi:PREDICTED: solute carrier organic anion transporter family member 1C1-like isoform X1 [Crocodylus porosus]|uniref:solute carrier organic anion transporter family member 1C1-like isoform X1 n=1 Tax=Crocodylus porosus TaxID=8502 RepID=UPI00093F0ED7|nr:PREDICTED: solute carrier organic anion transporter family member 1C1-like isoform X1 [Crocodylus porosus]XP_019400011.1 PREDICTED: solute carrier organic anion transporter family member 1C1-like isoform X1 [Crocodylus porosus]
MEKRIIPDQIKDKSLSQDKSVGPLPPKRIHPTFSKLKLFLGALAFSFFAKGLSGSYVKSISTQIERRFEIPSSLLGIIEGSFELGNLMVMILVSYLGPKVHRPKVIAVGCLIMSLGTFLSVMPHFLMGRYNYERISISVNNSSTSFSACSPTLSLHPSASDDMEAAEELKESECKKTANSYLWMFVLMGNLLRGIGEAPVIPLGISYIDDFAKEENSAFYIGMVRTTGMVGPTLGYLLGAFCASLWVDIGIVDLDSLTINPKDTRWVGAWWIGFLICGIANFLSSLPFWFLPYSLPKEEEKRNTKELNISSVTAQVDYSAVEPQIQPKLKFSKAVKDFLPTLKKLLGNPTFLVFLLLTIFQYNFMVALGTYEPKFMEQQFNVSLSNAIFLIGVILLPTAVLGMFLGSFITKKFKWLVTGMAKFSCITSIISYLLSLLYFMSDCEMLHVAGLTVSYSGIKQTASPKPSLIASCNSDCNCMLNQWDPVCGDNGITYMTACFAGCKSSTGSGKNMVFHNCSCMDIQSSGLSNFSAVLGQCQRESCTNKFPYFLVLLTVNAFTLSAISTPTYMIIFRIISPDLKSFAVGTETLIGRLLGGLPAPIYFGALIDQTCLKWGTKSCGGLGSCRVYDTKAFRNIYLGFISGLRTVCCFLYIVLFILIKKRFGPDSKDLKNTDVPSEKESASVCTKETFPSAKTVADHEVTCM